MPPKKTKQKKAASASSKAPSNQAQQDSQEPVDLSAESAFFEPRDLGDVALGGFLAVDEDEAQAPSPLGHESVAAGSTTTTTTTSAGVSDDAWFEKALSQAGAAGCGAVDLTGAAQESFAEQKRPMASELDTIDMLEAHLGEAEHVQPTLESLHQSIHLLLRAMLVLLKREQSGHHLAQQAIASGALYDWAAKRFATEIETEGIQGFLSRSGVRNPWAQEFATFFTIRGKGVLPEEQLFFTKKILAAKVISNMVTNRRSDIKKSLIFLHDRCNTSSHNKPSIFTLLALSRIDSSGAIIPASSTNLAQLTTQVAAERLRAWVYKMVTGDRLFNWCPSSYKAACADVLSTQLRRTPAKYESWFQAALKNDGKQSKQQSS